MSALRVFPSLLVTLLLAACVTINVYFPAVAAEKAADRIIEDVWGREGEPGPEAAPEQDEEPVAPGSRAPANEDREPAPRVRLEQEVTAWAMRTVELLIAPAHAQARPDIDISSPAIRRITASMERRHQQLLPYYQSGAIGLTREALLEVRDQAAVPLSERNQLRKLVADENQDRNALYREIAEANQHPEWVDQIRRVFAERWIAKARSGWYYETAGGGWTQK